MENAVKALIIAAGTLIAVMVLMLLVSLFKNASEVAYQHEQDQATLQMEQFNNRFSKYEGRDLNIHDLATIVNLAVEFNKKIEGSNAKPIEVILKSGAPTGVDWAAHPVTSGTLEGWMYHYGNNVYTMKAIDKSDDGIVDQIEISLKPTT